MYNSTNFNVTSKQVSIHQTNVVKIEGKFRGVSTTSYVQIHDSYAVPDEGAIPIKSYPLTPGGEFYKDYTIDNLPCSNGLYVCVSLTESTKTLSTETMDLFAEIFQPDYPPNTSTATAVDISLTVWTDAEGPKRLFYVNVINPESFSFFLILTAVNDPLTGDNIILDFWPVAATGDSAGNDNIKVSFGDGGHVPRQVSTSGVVTDACSFVLSTTSDSVNPIVPEVGPTIYVEYK